MSASLRIEGFRLLCRDVPATARFYEAALGARSGAAADGSPSMGIGSGMLDLARAATGSAPARSNSTAFQHLALVVSDMAAAMSRLASVTGWSSISRTGPERLPEESGGVTAFKFRDPEGHPLEFLAFLPHACPERWRGCDGVILGIDHSAITVCDVARSIAFYGSLGLSVASRQVNRGAAQERMDDVDGAVVDVVALAFPHASGPHLELLHYRVPGTHAEPVADDDVLATRIRLEGGNPRDLPSVDPDGHRLCAA
ncbi:VOC family protein [Methylobacterium sp. C25]|uniref:VOC family protein n=1 Tax=Methylobacterium sp. C25 TaxID=2721622 RepID=UPI001F20DC3F|nr:VOC family protein [Methylobacterium sp. C25]MCE4224956.1 VOC family protein [Methylobacterium sp. C25]